jgi:hypothetical protein
MCQGKDLVGCHHWMDLSQCPRPNVHVRTLVASHRSHGVCTQAVAITVMETDQIGFAEGESNVIVDQGS